MGTEQDFAAALDHALGIAFKTHHLKFPKLRTMIETHGSVDAARRLLNAPVVPQGLRDLIMHGCPELSIEYIAQEPEFQHLFNEKQIAAAAKRVPRVVHK